MGNRDKHRSIPLLAVSHAAEVGLNAFCSIDEIRVHGGGALEVGAKPVLVAEYRGYLGSNSHVTPTPLIQFGQNCEVEHREVARTLRWIHDYIRDTVFQRLEEYL